MFRLSVSRWVRLPQFRAILVSGDVSLSLAKSGGVGPGLADLQVKGDLTMAIRIVDDTMTLEIDNRVVAMARFGEHARRQQRCVDRLHSPARLFTRDQATHP